MDTKRSEDFVPVLYHALPLMRCEASHGCDISQAPVKQLCSVKEPQLTYVSSVVQECKNVTRRRTDKGQEAYAKTAMTCMMPPMRASRVLMMSLVSMRVLAMLRRCLQTMHVSLEKETNRASDKSSEMTGQPSHRM